MTATAPTPAGMPGARPPVPRGGPHRLGSSQPIAADPATASPASRLAPEQYARIKAADVAQRFVASLTPRGDAVPFADLAKTVVDVAGAIVPWVLTGSRSGAR